MPLGSNVGSNVGQLCSQDRFAHSAGSHLRLYIISNPDFKVGDSFFFLMVQISQEQNLTHIFGILCLHLRAVSTNVLEFFRFDSHVNRNVAMCVWFLENIFTSEEETQKPNKKRHITPKLF